MIEFDEQNRIIDEDNNIICLYGGKHNLYFLNAYFVILQYVKTPTTSC